MSEIILDLSRRYAAAFGLLASSNQPHAASVSDDYKLELYGSGDEEFENVQFIYDDQKVNFARMPFVSGTDYGNILAPPPLMTFSKSKKHVETSINGSDHVVVERWGTGPWDIRIRGLLIDIENRTYPESKITELYQLFSFNGIVEASGTQFFDKDIANVYFKHIAINGVQGFEDTIQFTLQAKAIASVGFTLLNPNS